MKRIRKIIIIIILLAFIFSMKIQAINYQKEDVYKTRTINILGIQIEFRDREYFSGENNSITEEEKENNNIVVGGFCGFLVIYWIILLIIFEKEDTFDYTCENSDEVETLKKYNPMIAGCLVDNRQVLARDVTAVILNLVQKKTINMKVIPNSDEKEGYRYIVSKNKNGVGNLDETERYVLNWIFGFYEQDEIELVDKLKEISTRKDFYKKLRELNKITQSKLNKMGANINKVPLFLRVANIFLGIISIIISIIHVSNNGLNIHIYETTMIFALIIFLGVIIILPVIVLVINLILILAVSIKRTIKIQTNKYSGKQIVSTSVIILVTMFILIALIYMVVPNKYICLDIFMIGMSVLIIKTDNLMTKHNKEIMHDYYALQIIKNKISEYTLLEEKEINYINLWEEYLVYAIAFGIPVEIVDKLKDTTKEDEDIEYLLKADSLYYICKAYLEVMWNMEFKETKNKYKVSSIFKELF